MNKKFFLLIFSLLIVTTIRCMEDSGNEPIENNELKSSKAVLADLFLSIDKKDMDAFNRAVQKIKHLAELKKMSKEKKKPIFGKGKKTNNSEVEKSYLLRVALANSFLNEQLRYIMASPFDVYSKKGETPLIRAIRKNRPEHVSRLLELGASTLVKHKTEEMFPMNYAVDLGENGEQIMAMIKQAQRTEWQEFERFQKQENDQKKS